MLRKILESLTATHLTVIVVAAMLIPGAVVAAVQYQAVAIVNPSTGSTSFVDGARRLYVLDPLAAYANDPSRVVNIYDTGSSGNRTIYTVPAGNVLVIKSAQFAYFGNTEGTVAYAYIYIYGKYLTTIEETRKAATIPVSFDAGLLAPAGALSVITGASSGATFVTSVQGYLIPASAAPSVVSSAAEGTRGAAPTQVRPQ